MGAGRPRLGFGSVGDQATSVSLDGIELDGRARRKRIKDGRLCGVAETFMLIRECIGAWSTCIRGCVRSSWHSNES